MKFLPMIPPPSKPEETRPRDWHYGVLYVHACGCYAMRIGEGYVRFFKGDSVPLYTPKASEWYSEGGWTRATVPLVISND